MHICHFVHVTSDVCVENIQHYCSQPDGPLRSSMEPCTVVGKPGRERAYLSERTWSESPPTAPPVSMDLFHTWTRQLAGKRLRMARLACAQLLSAFLRMTGLH